MGHTEIIWKMKEKMKNLSLQFEIDLIFTMTLFY